VSPSAVTHSTRRLSLRGVRSYRGEVDEAAEVASHGEQQTADATNKLARW
jgi:hypothetical protein